MQITRNERTVSKISRNYLGVPIFLIGSVVAALPRLVYGMEQSMHGMPMRCYATANAEIAIGTAIFLFGALYFFSKSAKIRLTASVLAIGAAVLALTFPLGVTGLCGDTHMTCHILTLPALFVSASLITLFSGIGIALSVRNLRNEGGGSRSTYM
ncbi:MAG: DUF4418 family protein [Syntrophomonadaceae bacterium]|jgi:hypothetical protein|nr:DUF4418 family protein [Syntrophomonadaceae bacterium]